MWKITSCFFSSSANLMKSISIEKYSNSIWFDLLGNAAKVDFDVDWPLTRSLASFCCCCKTKWLTKCWICRECVVGAGREHVVRRCMPASPLTRWQVKSDLSKHDIIIHLMMIYRRCGTLFITGQTLTCCGVATTSNFDLISMLIEWINVPPLQLKFGTSGR